MRPCFQTIGEIRITNRFWAMEDTPAYSIAVRLLGTSFQGMPVLDAHGKVIGKVTEMDVLKALQVGLDLKQITAKDIMGSAPPVVGTGTTLERAVEIMDAHHLIRLPVMKEGHFIGSVTRHDVLRAWLGVWAYDERGNYAEVIG